MTIRKATLRAIGFVIYLIVVGGMLALIFFQSLNASKDRRQLLEQVAELEQQSAEQVLMHRDANQSDHDEAEDYHRCMLRFVVIITDPARDRSVRPELPEGCEDTVAVDEIRNGEAK